MRSSKWSSPEDIETAVKLVDGKTKAECYQCGLSGPWMAVYRYRKSMQSPSGQLGKKKINKRKYWIDCDKIKKDNDIEEACRLLSGLIHFVFTELRVPPEDTSIDSVADVLLGHLARQGAFHPIFGRPSVINKLSQLLDPEHMEK